MCGDAQTGPVGKRIEILDIIRGFAVTGILYASGYLSGAVYKLRNILIWIIPGLGFTYLSINLEGSFASFPTSMTQLLAKLAHEVDQVS